MWPVFDRCNVYKSEISQQETLEHISTIAGSLAESLGTMSQVMILATSLRLVGKRFS